MMGAAFKIVITADEHGRVGIQSELLSLNDTIVAMQRVALQLMQQPDSEPPPQSRILVPTVVAL